MIGRFCWLIALITSSALSIRAAEKKFDFSTVPENQTPPGFRNAVTGQGKPGTWRVVLDDLPSGLQTLSPEARGTTRRAVLAQVAEDQTDEHFPLLIYEEDTYSDFMLTTRFKTVGGKVERMAGIAFRMQNETNYYVVRASSLGNTFRFYKVVNGERGAIVGPDIEIPSGTWHELTVACKGNEIRCSLDGKDLISATDKIDPFWNGKFAFWTKSDSITYFADTRIVYTPREPPAQSIVKDTLKKYPKLIDVKIYVADGNPNGSRLIACRDSSQVGSPGGEAEKLVLADKGVYSGKDKDQHTVSVMMPVRDRNGESVAAVRVVMKPLPGQTEQNVIVRATPVVQSVQARVLSLQDLIN